MFKFSNSLKQILLVSVIYLISIYLLDLIRLLYYLDSKNIFSSLQFLDLILDSFFYEKSKSFCKIIKGSVSVFFWEVIIYFLGVLFFCILSVGFWAVPHFNSLLLKLCNLKLIKDSINIMNYKDTWLNKSKLNFIIFSLCIILFVPILYIFIFFSFYDFYCFK